MALIKGRPVSEEDTTITPDDTKPAFVPEGNEGAGEEGESVIATEGDEAVVTPAGEEEEKPFMVFKTQKEMDDYMAEHAPKPSTTTPAPAKPAEPAAPAAPATTKEEENEIDKLTFWEGYRDPETGKWVGKAPADWNDFARTIIKHLDPKAQAPKILEEIRNMTAKEKADLQKIDAEYDAEFDELASQGLVPKRGTKEGDAANLAISTLGGEYGLTSMKKAYELWSKIPADKGGGLGYKPTTEKKPNPSKEASRLIGSSGKSNAAGKPSTKIPYSKLHAARSVDDLLDD